MICKPNGEAEVTDEPEEQRWTYPYFRPEELTEVTSGDLPHWQQEGKICFVTYRLADSLPLHAVKEFKETVGAWKAKHNLVLSEAEYQELERLKFDLMEQLLEKSLGSCILRNPEVRRIVSESLQHFNHLRYHLHSYVIMPNHVHVMAEPAEGYTLRSCVSTWKSYTAHAINKLLGRKGEVWQRESFDRIVRSARNYCNVVNYIARNPQHCREGEFELFLTTGRPHFKRIEDLYSL